MIFLFLLFDAFECELYNISRVEYIFTSVYRTKRIRHPVFRILIPFISWLNWLPVALSYLEINTLHLLEPTNPPSVFKLCERSVINFTSLKFDFVLISHFGLKSQVNSFHEVLLVVQLSRFHRACHFPELFPVFSCNKCRMHIFLNSLL